MIKLFIYNKLNRRFLRSDLGVPEYVIKDLRDSEDFTLIEPPTYESTWRWIDTEWVELLPINNPDIPYSDEHIWNPELNQWELCPELDAYKHLEEQELMWEQIKERRLQAITSGVYVESVDKWFHTDTVSATTYSTIAGIITLDNYEPVQWKTMDNTWLLLTESLFKELQTAMSQKTNTNYAVAEQHKAAMLLADNPLEYDYSTNWV